jgi:hypothetical protein
MLAKEGLVRCTVLPPRKLVLSGAAIQVQRSSTVLPVQDVAESGYQDQSNHDTVSKKALTATCVVDEVRLGEDRGYRVFKIHEIRGNTV